jgi:hypothetical protein
MFRNNSSFRENLITLQENDIEYEGINFIAYLVPRTLTLESSNRTLSQIIWDYC